MSRLLSPDVDEDVENLAQYIGFYLSETVNDLTDWDCEHLAINMLNELKIEEPQFPPFAIKQ